jgi:sn-glycerol 3-phosphate transport system substrate-binding protein
MRSFKFVVLLLVALGVLVGCAAPTAAPTSAPPTKAPAPTTAPVAQPTTAPVAQPTTAPVAKPTDAPAAKPTDAPKPAATTKITVWYPLPTTGPLQEAMNALVKKFNAAGKGVEVEMVLTGNYGDNFTKILAAATANNLPDAAMVELLQIPQLANSNQLLALDDMSKEADFNFNDLAPALLGNSYFNNKLYAIPWQRSTTMMFYNRDMFKAAGLDPDKPPLTWDEAKAATQKLLAKDPNVVPMTGAIASDWAFEAQLLSFNGALLSKDGKSATYNSPEAVAAVTVWRDMSKDKLLSIRGSGDFGAVVNDFIAGKNAMVMQSIFSRATIEQQAKFDWDVAAVPGGPAGPVLNAGGGNFVIFGKTAPEKQKAAWTFIKWMTSPENTAEYSIKSGYLPVRTSALTAPAMVDYGKQSPKTVKAMNLALKYGKSRAVSPVFEKAINQFLNPALQDILLGTADPKTALDAAAKKSTDALQ